MSADLILYDRIWLQDYIEHLRLQRALADDLKRELQRKLFQCQTEQKRFYEDILSHVYTLEYSLEITETVLREYLDHVQDAAIHFQNQCMDVEIPDFFK